MAGDGDGMSHSSPDTRPTAVASLRMSRHPRRELPKPHQCANRLSQALQTSSQAPLQVPAWPKGLPGDRLPALGSDTSSRRAARVPETTPLGCMARCFWVRLAGKEGPAASPCPRCGEWADESCQAPVVWTPRVAFAEATPGLAGSATSRAGFWDAWDRPIPRWISSGHKLGENSFF